MQVGGAEPTSNSDFVTSESYVVPESSLQPGTNIVRIVAVDADSDVGTYSQSFTVSLNVTPPVVQSSTHPTAGQWYSSNDVLVSWHNPLNVPAGAFVGYYYLWNEIRRHGSRAGEIVVPR